MRAHWKSVRLLLVTVLLLSGSACATQPAGSVAEDPEAAALADENDPLEPLNRQVFAVNLTLDTFVLRPAAVGYRELVPAPVKRSVRNFVNNLKEPWTLVNNLLQGDFERAQITYGRFLLNSLYGIGGLFDVASDHGLAYRQEDFGQTLAAWGVPEGWYLVLPGLGPSNLRDAAGRGAQWWADPVSLLADEAGAGDFLYVRTGLNAVDSRWRALGSLDTLRDQSLDLYAAVRSLYRQRRAAQLENRDGREED
jgi:phospholipid-binding lipoprotein MlaA